MVGFNRLTGWTDRQIYKETMDCESERWIRTVMKLHCVWSPGKHHMVWSCFCLDVWAVHLIFEFGWIPVLSGFRIRSRSDRTVWPLLSSALAFDNKQLQLVSELDWNHNISESWQCCTLSPTVTPCYHHLLPLEDWNPKLYRCARFLWQVNSFIVSWKGSVESVAL